MDAETFEKLHGQYEILKTSMKSEKLGTETEPKWEHSPIKLTFDDMLQTIENHLQKLEKNDKHYHRLLAMQGALLYQQAKILVQLSETEKAQDVLKKSTELLKDFLLVPEVTFLGLRVLNHYCYLLTKNGDLVNSQSLLELAEGKYMELKEDGDLSDKSFYSNDDLFAAQLKLTPNKEVVEKLERLVTNNLQMLGYVYNKQGNMDKFTKYHHQVLKRQLDMREGDATVWAMKTARLGYFFLTRNKFAQARHHLAAACYVLSQYENTLKTLETSDLVMAKWEELNHRYADIAKCWVKYGLFLFNASKMKLVTAFYGESAPFLDHVWTNPFESFIYGCSKSEGNEEPGVWVGSNSKLYQDELHNSMGTTNLKAFDGESSGSHLSSFNEEIQNQPGSEVFDVIFENSNPSNVSIGIVGTDASQTTSSGTSDSELADKKIDVNLKQTEEPEYKFSNLDLSCFENCVSCSYVDSLQSARALFIFTHSWLKKSKLFYTLKDHPMEYVNVILDLSELYRFLAFYEDDIENQYVFQKRRADTLETLSAVLKEVRPQCYIAVSIELLRELAEIHLELMGLNLRRIYLSQPEMEKEAEANAETQGFGELSEQTLQKMEAVADIHQRLDHFSDALGHGALGDFESGSVISSVGNDINDILIPNLFEPLPTDDF